MSEQDRNDIIMLKRVTRPTQYEMDLIYTLYKRYIDEGARMYCPSCNNVLYYSIQNYWNKIIRLV